MSTIKIDRGFTQKIQHKDLIHPPNLEPRPTKHNKKSKGGPKWIIFAVAGVAGTSLMIAGSSAFGAGAGRAAEACGVAAGRAGAVAAREDGPGIVARCDSSARSSSSFWGG